MEDWEIAPGRIREDGADQPNSKSLHPPMMYLLQLCEPYGGIYTSAHTAWRLPIRLSLSNLLC